MKRLAALLTVAFLMGAALIPALAAPDGDPLVPPGASRRPSSEPGQQKIIARYTDAEVHIDGALSPGEWSAAIPYPVKFTQPDMTPGLPFPPESYDVPRPSDLSYTIRAMYDHGNLYIAVDVADDDLCGDSGDAVWYDDDVEIFIDGDRENTCPSGDWAFICDMPFFADYCQRCSQTAVGTDDLTDFSRSTAEGGFIYGGKEGFQLLTSVAGNATATAQGEVLWMSAVGERPRGYLVEYEIALESIDTADGPAVAAAGPGDVLGFTVAVGDDDGGCGAGYEAPDDNFGVWDGWFLWWTEDYWGTLYLEPARPPKKPVLGAEPSTTWGAVKQESSQ